MLPLMGLLRAARARPVARIAAAVPRWPAARAQSSAAALTNIIDKDDSLSHIQAHDKYGFTVNGIHMRGSVLVFRNFTLLWDVQRIVDVCPRNLAPVHMVRPHPEILLVGTGARMENINPSLYAYMSRKGIAIEPMTTSQAIATFNTLVQEGRKVAAALVSREPVPRDEACFYTDEPLETEADVRLKTLLARDYSVDEMGRLLEGGPSSTPLLDTSDNAAAAAAAARSAAYGTPQRNVGRAAGDGSAASDKLWRSLLDEALESAVRGTSSTDFKSMPVQYGRSYTEEELRQLPGSGEGAAGASAGPKRTVAEAEAASSERRVLARRKTAQELAAEAARKSMRRSSGKR